jgi:hypothetical protein
MNNNELQREIKALKSQVTSLNGEIVKLYGIINKGKSITSRKIIETTDFRGKVECKNKVAMRGDTYIKDVADISLTAIGNTSETNQATNITANFNKIINALNND